MPVTRENIIQIPITDQMYAIADYVAQKRILFEYPREGYGNYGDNHIIMIRRGILGELAVLEYIFSYLNNQYRDYEPIERYKILHREILFSYEIIIGRFDNGFDFKFRDRTIDVKTYATHQVSIEQILQTPLNLFIEANQNAVADFYIQTFLLQEHRTIALAGFSRELPPLATWMPNEAYTRPVPELEAMEVLLGEINA